MTVDADTGATGLRLDRRSALLGVLISALAVLYINAYGPWMPSPGDLALAFPISKEIADPGLYSEGDLVVSSGLRMPFHVYRLASLLYAANLDVDLIWHLLHQVFLLLTFHAIWLLAWVLSRNMHVAAVAVGIVASMSFMRGALHWGLLPLTSLVTAQVAQPIALYALTALFSRRFMSSLALAALTFTVHPYVGLLTILTVTSVLLFNGSQIPLSRRILWLAAGAALSLPNAIYILLSLPQNVGIGTDAPSNQAFYDQFRIYAWHAFPADHWREGYGWVALNLAGLGFATRFIDSWSRRCALIVISTLLIAMAVYVLTLYVFRIKLIMLMFLFRATYLTKPLMVVLLVTGIHAWIQHRAANGRLPILDCFVPGGFALMCFSPSIIDAEAIGLATYSLLLLRATDRRALQITAAIGLCTGIGLLGGHAILGDQAEFQRIAVPLTILAAVALFAAFRSAPEPTPVDAGSAPAGSTPRAWVVSSTFIAVIVSSMLVRTLWSGDLSLWNPTPVSTLGERMRMSTPRPELAGLTQWARNDTPRGSLFCIPPTLRIFQMFRLQAERGVFATVHDVNQLAFDAGVYREAHNRLLSIGMRVTGRHAFDDSNYYGLPVPSWAEIHRAHGVRYAVFYAPALGAQWTPVPPVFFDGNFVAFDLSNLAGQSNPSDIE